MKVKRIHTDDLESNIKQKGKRRTKKAVLTGQVNKGTSNSSACRRKKLITFLRAFPVSSESTPILARARNELLRMQRGCIIRVNTTFRIVNHKLLSQVVSEQHYDKVKFPFLPTISKYNQLTIQKVFSNKYFCIICFHYKGPTKRNLFVMHNVYFIVLMAIKTVYNILQFLIIINIKCYGNFFQLCRFCK